MVSCHSPNPHYSQQILKLRRFVQSGARVEQFDKLCEVQSDKAATEVCCPYGEAEWESLSVRY